MLCSLGLSRKKPILFSESERNGKTLVLTSKNTKYLVLAAHITMLFSDFCLLGQSCKKSQFCCDATHLLNDVKNVDFVKFFKRYYIYNRLS